jgi:hypothetical protein
VHELGQIVALKKSINLNNAQSRENLINPRISLACEIADFCGIPAD